MSVKYLNMRVKNKNTTSQTQNECKILKYEGKK